MRTTTYPSRLPFVVDPNSIDRNGGRQIDWSLVPEHYRATAVKVTVGAQALANATSITVAALTAAIPAGSIVYFGAIGSGKFAKLTAAAAVGATALTVEAIPKQIENADVGYYGGIGGKVVPAGTVMAELSTGKIIPRAAATALAAVATAGTNTGNGAMGAITVGAGAQAGTYTLRITRAAANAGDFVVEDPNGQIVGYGAVGSAFSGGGLSFTLADGATDFVLNDSFSIAVAGGTAFTTIGLLETEAEELNLSNASTGFGLIIGGAVYENMLPESTGSPKVLPTVYKSELRAPGVGKGWSWHQYGDNRS